MTDLELAQQALPGPNFENHDNGDMFGVDKTFFYTAHEMLDMYLAGMAKAREIDAGICDDYAKEAWGITEEEYAAQQLAVAIRSQGKK
jgi:hypothetical protein